MSFYDLPKPTRLQFVAQINSDILQDILENQTGRMISYFSDGDTYTRKSAYLAIGKISISQPSLQSAILSILSKLLESADSKIRQTVINAAGEIGIREFEPVETIFDRGLLDKHSSVRNAVIGSVKKMGARNPVPVLNWARKYLHHPDKEIRREICHGIELRGRAHPADILPLLNELQYDKTARVRNTLIHVLGQISYKKNCLTVVIEHLNRWENKGLVAKAIEEIIDVHHRYKDFAAMSQEEALAFIRVHLAN